MNSGEEYACAICKYKCHKQSNLKAHFLTKKHLNASSKNAGNEYGGFSCESCAFFTEKRADYERHIRTQKHRSAGKPSESSSTASSSTASSSMETLTGAVLEMVKQNTEFRRILVETQQQTQKQYTELLETCTRPPVIQHTTNHFNIQCFLNVACKDAIPIGDFITGLNIQQKDIEHLGRVGFVEGITKILMNGLNGLEQHKRPIHCTDLKRDTMYIKEADRWEKDFQNARLMRAIETVEQINCRLFMKTVPAPLKDDADQYMSILREVNGGSADSREKNRAKIVKNISKACILERTIADGAVALR